ncbi:MAG TPA: lactate utilization protein B [Paracoccaceae bacterium]|nr:lactate utilization protein B [Paracoccaceae bacterium]
MNAAPNSRNFKENARAALVDADLQRALRASQGNFIRARSAAREGLPEFDALRDRARDLKDHVLANLGDYLAEYEENVLAAGGHVHWAETAEDARAIVLGICRDAGARTVNKGKTLISEECGINAHLAANGIEPIETDLGEYIVQLRGETPSHVIAPAIHVAEEKVAELFRARHGGRDPGRELTLDTMLAEARGVLREKYFEAEVGITGANMLVARTGHSVIVTNEGNGDLSQSLSRVHIVMASIEKIVPTLEDAATILRVLARSATGQEASVYTTFSAGPRRAGDPDGPDEYHVVLLDNGRSNMLGGEFEEMLRCIRRGACMNHCLVYTSIGGHVYGAVYPGPMGAVLMPALEGIAETRHLPNASTFCGRCEEVCPVRIPLPRLMRHWREREFERRLTPAAQRWGLGFWRFLAMRPRAYRLAGSIGSRAMRLLGRKGRILWLPFGQGWTRHRDMPAPEGGSFQAKWGRSERGQSE